MLRWLWSRTHHQPVPLRRADRRALTRMSRPDRQTVETVISKLRRLPLKERLAVVEGLPEYQREWLEGRL